MKRYLHYILAELFLLVGFGIAILGIVISRNTIREVALSDLGLSGQLLLSEGYEGLKLVDAATGEVTVLFKPPRLGYVASASFSPDASTVVLAYAPPPESGVLQFGYTDLYILPGESAEPELFLESEEDDSFSRPVWSPDGHYIYYTRAHRETGDQEPQVWLERIAYPDGESEVVLEDAQSVRFSPDGSRIGFIRLNPDTFHEELYLADAGGPNAALLLPAGAFEGVDSFAFSPDGSMVVFSAFGEPSRADAAPERLPAFAWAHALFGVRRASAHEDVPSDLWAIPVEGGDFRRLTTLEEINLIPDYAPDGQHISLIASGDLYVLRSDGSSLSRIELDGNFIYLHWFE